MSTIDMSAPRPASTPEWKQGLSGGRALANRVSTVLVWLAAGLALVPLVWMLWLVVGRGGKVVDGDFLTYSMRGVIGMAQGGIYHALMGTLIITGIALVVAVPIGIMAAIYLVEYGKGKPMAKAVTYLVDIMTGIPSIVAGLFAFALMALLVKPERFGLAGSIALIVLMIPTVVRSTEEMLKLVPADLREASYALGVPKWRTVVKVVLTTAASGIVTGVILAISRVIGETAPLLVTAGASASTNTNPLDNPMMTLPVFIYDQFQQAEPQRYAYAWGGALVLLVLVLILNFGARLIGRWLAPKKGD